MKYACGICRINLISYRAKRDISQFALANYFILRSNISLVTDRSVSVCFSFSGFVFTNPMLAAVCDNLDICLNMCYCIGGDNNEQRVK